MAVIGDKTPKNALNVARHDHCRSIRIQLLTFTEIDDGNGTVATDES